MCQVVATRIRQSAQYANTTDNRLWADMLSLRRCGGATRIRRRVGWGGGGKDGTHNARYILQRHKNGNRVERWNQSIAS